MARLKLILRMGGVMVFCLPVGYGANPKRDQSVFYNLADLGAFIRLGLILMAVGAVAFVMSHLLPGKMDDEFWG